MPPDAPADSAARSPGGPAPSGSDAPRPAEDHFDVGIALERLRDPTDPVLDWDDIKRELLAAD